VDPSGTFLSILGAFISHDFSKMLLKECLTMSSKKDEVDDFCQGLEELNELVEYISETGKVLLQKKRTLLRKKAGSKREGVPIDPTAPLKMY